MLLQKNCSSATATCAASLNKIHFGKYIYLFATLETSWQNDLTFIVTNTPTGPHENIGISVYMYALHQILLTLDNRLVLFIHSVRQVSLYETRSKKKSYVHNLCMGFCQKKKSPYLFTRKFLNTTEVYAIYVDKSYCRWLYEFTFIVGLG